MKETLNPATPRTRVDRSLPGAELEILRSAIQAALDTLNSLELRLLADDSKAEIDLYDTVRNFEICLIKNALHRAGGKQVRAAALLKMKVTTLNLKMKVYDLRNKATNGGS